MYPRAEQRDDVRLVQLALAGEPVAVDALVRRLMPVVCARVRNVLARTGRGLEARDRDDLVQEIWVELLADGGRRLRAYEPRHGTTLEGFVGLITERELAHVRDRARAKKRGGHLQAVDLDAAAQLPSPTPTPEERFGSAEMAAKLGAHLEQVLPARGQLVFRHAFTDGRSPTETAELMGVTVQVVYNWTHKIRAATRAFLGVDDD